MADTQYSDDEVEQRLRDDAKAKNVEYSDSDLQDVRHRDNSQEAIDMAGRKYDERARSDSEHAPDSVTNQWQTLGGGESARGGADDILSQMRKEMQAREAADGARRDALYKHLEDRAGQALNFDASDPIIKAQTDAFRAQQDRSKRDYLSNVAERGGPDANMRGEQRMAAEKTGQATSGFQAELMGREMGSRRQEIASALQQQGGILNADQQMQLQQELGIIDQNMRQQGVDMQGRGLDLDWKKAMLNNDQFMADLGLRAGDRANYWDYANTYGL